MSAVIQAQVPSSTVTATLAEWALARETDRMPGDVREAARRCVLDWMAVSLAGADDPLIRILIDAALEEGGNPRCTLVAQSERVSPLQAALINGATSHAFSSCRGIRKWSVFVPRRTSQESNGERIAPSDFWMK